MNKELSDRVWKMLPKEFKEEVKKMFEEDKKHPEIHTTCGITTAYHNDMGQRLIDLFGIHNLTSDAEGEEMLCAPKSKAMQLYSHLLDLVENEHMSEHYSEWCDVESEYIALFGENVFADYFGSKCLPDEEKPQPKFHNGDRVKVITDCWKDNIYTILDIKEVYPQFSYKLSCSPDDWFAESTLELAKEPKPFKYNVGQKVILHFYGGEVSTITEAFNDGGVWNKYKVKMLPARVWNENELDPYEEPKPAEPKFHKGDKVEVINYDFGLPSLSRCVHEVFTVSDVKYNANQWMYKLETNKWLFNERDYLESIQWCEHFLKAYKEPKPAEPKFKEGDRALIKARVVNVWQRSGSTLFNTLFNYDILLDDGRTANWVDEQWLLPDNDDQVRAVTEKASEQFDTIVKGGFRNERRLNIATQITASIYANDKAASRFDSIEALVRKALDIADTLIAECEKGGNQD